MVQVAAVAWVWFLAQALPFATDAAQNKNTLPNHLTYKSYFLNTVLSFMKINNVIWKFRRIFNIQYLIQFLTLTLYFCYTYTEEVYCSSLLPPSLSSFFFFSFLLFRAAPVAYGGFQVRSLIRTTASGLRHNHSNAGSEPRVQPTPQLTAILYP